MVTGIFQRSKICSCGNQEYSMADHKHKYKKTGNRRYNAARAAYEYEYSCSCGDSYWA